MGGSTPVKFFSEATNKASLFSKLRTLIGIIMVNFETGRPSCVEMRVSLEETSPCSKMKLRFATTKATLTTNTEFLVTMVRLTHTEKKEVRCKERRKGGKEI